MEVNKRLVIGIVAILLGFLLLAPFADPNPDGLESTAEQNHAPEGSSFDLGFLTDYGAYGSMIYKLFENEFLSIIVSGLVGILIVLSLFLVPYYILKQRHLEDNPSEDK